MSHTPGPWRSVEGALGAFEITAGTHQIAQRAGWNRATTEESWANARLIAVAPDLLAALRSYLDARPQCQCTPHSGCQMAKARFAARAAIAKAEGTTP